MLFNLRAHLKVQQQALGSQFGCFALIKLATSKAILKVGLQNNDFAFGHLGHRDFYSYSVSSFGSFSPHGYFSSKYSRSTSRVESI